MADRRKGSGAFDNASGMTDKKKGSGADNVSTPKPSKISKILDSLNKICCIAKELKDDPLGVDELERLLDNQRKLTEQLRAKDAQISDLTTEVESLQTAKSLLWEEFHDQYQDVTAELDDLRDARIYLEETRTKLMDAEDAVAAAKSEHKKLRLGVEKTAEYKKMAEERLKSVQEKLENLRLRSAGVEVKYRELAEFIGVDQLEDRNAIGLEDELEKFASTCHEEIRNAMMAVPIPTEPPREIPRAVAYARVSTLHTTPYTHVPVIEPPVIARATLESIPLPWSTSKEARLMRCAYAEHVFAKALVNYIFVAISTRKAPELQQAANTVLKFLEAGDNLKHVGSPRRETIVRSQLLAALSDDNNSDKEYAINAAQEYITDTLNAIVPPGSARDSVYPMFAGLLRQAETLWAPFRRDRFRISAQLDIHWRRLVRADDCYRDYGAPDPSRRSYEVIVPLFPQVIKDHNILINPRVLWSDQTAVVAARAELKKLRDETGYKGDVLPIQQPKRRNSLRPSMVSQGKVPDFVLWRMQAGASCGLPHDCPVSAREIWRSDRGGDGVVHDVHDTDTGGSMAGKGTACAVSVTVKLPEGGTEGSQGSAATP